MSDLGKRDVSNYCGAKGELKGGKCLINDINGIFPGYL